tara:strand:+ start:11926 stop:12618 length:693 start_codon:yes stop_codon:yes gene_type:complete
MRNKINIAIDGYSSCGKSTIAKSISNKYNMNYIDTGAMYRAVALYCIKNGIMRESVIDYNKLELSLKNIHIDFVYNTQTKLSETYLNYKNVEYEIRGIEVSNSVSEIAKVSAVREKLIKIQRSIGLSKNVVMDGRDIGTVVFPEAEIKFFIKADIKIRAKRRYNEMKSKNIHVNLHEIIQNIKMRDEKDINRQINPLIVAKDAIIVDTTNVSLLEQDKIIFSEIDKILNV